MIDCQASSVSPAPNTGEPRVKSPQDPLHLKDNGTRFSPGERAPGTGSTHDSDPPQAIPILQDEAIALVEVEGHQRGILLEFRLPEGLA